MGRLSVGFTTMAYSSVRVQFEIGHEASVRTKKTPEGFTHDWEVFVRGADNTDIQCFVDKVVFHLHETFPKPRRVIKEPPYVVKESGYAGFVLPIDVYLKNKEEPKKISFQYDLTLQSSGPPISRVLREPRLFQNPSEDFRRKLIRGGGVGVDTPSESSLDEIKSASSVTQNKLKPVESPAKKHKPDLSSNHSFAELFGTPIRRVQEPKKLPETTSKKVDDKKKTNKPYKEEKEKYLEREKTKEKIKRPPSPSLPPPPAPPLVKPKEEHKKYEEREKKKEEEKKKRKDEKEKKEKAKEPERQQEREMKKEKKEMKDGEYVKKMNSKPSDLKPYYEQKHNNESLDREKERLEKEKHKHRHKKKEKEKNREKEKHRKEKDSKEKEKEKIERKKLEEIREKEEKRRKSRSPSPPVQIKKGPLNALLDELGSSDSASPLSEEESIPSIKPIVKTPAKTVPETKSPAISTPKLKSTNSIEPTPKTDDSNTNKTKKEKVPSKKSKKSEKDLEKKKEKEEPRARSVSSERERLEREEEVEKEKANKEERLDKEKQEEDKQKSKKRKREKSEEKQTKVKKNETSQSAAVEGSDETTEELRKPDKFTKEYVAQLRDLQHRIMTLEDNAELQKVVKVIAETGQYEVTKKTFDFDLCALDLETVKRLQEFFSPT